MTHSLPQSVYWERVQKSVAFLKEWHPGPAPDLVVVLGSGLAQAVPQLQEMKGVPYANIPGCTQASVLGHAGELRVGTITSSTKQKRDVVFLSGRVHMYEGHNPGEVVHNIRMLLAWGVKGVVLTNAAGCMVPDWNLGHMMVVRDHINFTGTSPLLGEWGRNFGERFIDMSACYDPTWHTQFSTAPSQQKVYSGVYFGVLGCQYETPAEVKMIQTLGGHAVGMSTVLESIAVRQMGAKLAAVSYLTNYGPGMAQKSLSHTDVLEFAKRGAQSFQDVVLNTLPNLKF